MPEYNLKINSLPHGEMTGRMLIEIEKILLREKPDFVIVYGDTNSTLAGALSASKLNIPVIHIEAGLRSFNMKMPEEVNRILTDRISTVLFCPGKLAVDNLRKEGINKYNVIIKNSGDVMYDVLLYFKKFRKKPDLRLNNNFILCTVHREENTNIISNLEAILKALIKISTRYQIIFPVHPRTKLYLSKIKHIENKVKECNIVLSKPLGYLEIIYLLEKCKLVLTDSGGLQKEAYYMKKPCIVLRNESEWMELVENNFNFLTGANTKKIIDTFDKIEGKKFVFNKFFYGRGNASEKIVNFIKDL